MKTLSRFAIVCIGLAACAAAVAQENKPAEPQANPTPQSPQPGAPGVTPPLSVPQVPGTPTPNPDPNAPQPKLELSDTVWDFGTVWSGQNLEKEITVKNTGQAPLQLTVRTSCGCTTAKKPKDVLAPGESDTMKLGYSSKKRPGKASQTVTVQTNDPSNPAATIKVEGEVKAVYSAQPGPSIAFGRLGRDSKDKQTITITNEYPEKLNLKLKAQPEGPFEIELKELEAGTKYELSATSKPPLAMGLAKADVELETGIELLPIIDIHVQGYVQPPVMVSPTVLYVPAKSTQNMERIVRVTYVTDKPIQITSLKPSLETIQARVNPPTTMPAGSTMGVHDIRVTLPPADQIPETGATLEINTDWPDDEFKKLSVQITTQRPGMPAASVPQPAGGVAAPVAPTPGAVSPAAPKPVTPPPANPAPADKPKP